MEMNKIFAAVLVAAIVAMFGGFLTHLIYHPDIPEEMAYHVDVPEDTGSGGPAAPQVADSIAALIAGADAARGKKLSKACTSCHSFDKGGATKTGPNLFGIYNAKVAGDSGFKYSSALAEKGGTWDQEALNQFLWKPKKAIPGTKMNYVGLKKPEDRAAMVKWLQTLK